MGFCRKKEEVCEECGLERVERKNVEELIESVQIMSKQLEMILEEVVKRDEVIEKLEEEIFLGFRKESGINVNLINTKFNTKRAKRPLPSRNG